MIEAQQAELQGCHEALDILVGKLQENTRLVAKLKENLASIDKSAQAPRAHGWRSRGAKLSPAEIKERKRAYAKAWYAKHKSKA
jgi:hypothetical protein